MPSVAASVPDERSLLCEGCGYTLDGLPPGASCPECGKPVEESTGVLSRRPAAWEDSTDRRSAFVRFWATTFYVMFTPRRFYKSFTTRNAMGGGRAFALIHWGIAALLFGIAAVAHWRWYMDIVRGSRQLTLLVWAAASAGSFAALVVTTRVASWLTAWEARYRGLRLPLPVVRRGLDYHAAHYLPVGLVAVATTIGYDALYLRGIVSPDSYPYYFYALCGEVVLGAVYLFHTYWIGMKNMMYANR